MNKKQFSILVVISITLFLIIIFMVYSTTTSKSFFFNNTQDQSNLKEENPTIKPTQVKEVSIDDSITKPEPNKGEEISNLIDKTPHSGTFFNLTYNFDDGYFYLYINPAGKIEGNKEFNDFLKQNGIENRSQIPNLRNTSTKP